MALRLRTLLALCAVVLLIFAPSGALAAPPSAAAEAAAAALQGFQARHAGDAATWGLTPSELSDLTLAGGYHVVTWYTAPQAGAAPQIAPVAAGDQWVFVAAGPDGAPVLFVFVAQGAGGWAGVRVQRLSPDLASALSDALALLHATGLTLDREPDYFMIGGYAFWDLHAGGYELLYPTLPPQHPAMAEFGLDRQHLYPAGPTLKRLDSSSNRGDGEALGGGDGSGASRIRHYLLWGAGGLALAGPGWYLLRRRRGLRA